ncbi:hypothetical protein MSG28_004815 [Choristoneura fumiferana]|uniref:Uncharacterized protein n=1 Tax=Choristoneura fumiferana TaxID=7141 RepID=A0ACC0K8R6_CHOFU|nr:hypothetical protein MSG28_004815 [Choristoneura fumiferana]
MSMAADVAALVSSKLLFCGFKLSNMGLILSKVNAYSSLERRSRVLRPRAPSSQPEGSATSLLSSRDSLSSCDSPSNALSEINFSSFFPKSNSCKFHNSANVNSTLQVIPERALLTFVNEKYLFNASLIIKRHSRRSKYCFNIEAVTKQRFDDNMTIRRRTPIHILVDPPGVRGPQNEHLRIMNMTVPADDFPNVWPFERCKVKASITHTPTSDIVATADIYSLLGTGVLSEEEGLGSSSYAGPVRIGNLTHTIELLRILKN